MVVLKTHKELKDVLLEPLAKGVKEPYFVIRGRDQSVTVLNPGKNGIEFNKTYGHFHKYKGVEIYNCLFGQGILIMQRNDENSEPKEFKVSFLNAGKQIEIPAGYGHCLVNVGRNFLVVADNAPTDPRLHDYEAVRQRHGFVYYIVEKKGEIGFELNRNYKTHPQITSE